LQSLSAPHPCKACFQNKAQAHLVSMPRAISRIAKLVVDKDASDLEFNQWFLTSLTDGFLPCHPFPLTTSESC
jgi:hypothetical protein